MLEKVTAWIKATGLTNIAYAGGFFGALTLGYPMVAGACAGIFIYVNFNVLRKLVMTGVSKL